MAIGNLSLSGRVSARLIRPPRAPLTWRLKNTFRWSYIWGLIGYLWAKCLSRLTGIPTFTATLRAKFRGADGSIVDYGIVSRRLVTTAFVNFLVDQLQAETTEIGDFKFHDSGIGTTAEDAGDTDIETTDGEARVSGTQEEGASANIYKSVATITYSTAKAITEHGLFSALTGGTLMDRSVFAAINVAQDDSIQFSYELSVNSGG